MFLYLATGTHPFHHHYTQIPYMFEQILELVKDHIGNDPQIAQHIPPEQADAVHQAIAEHVTNTLQSQPTQEPATQSPLGGLGALTGQGGLSALTAQGGLSGLVSQFTNSLQSGSPIAAAIEGGLVGTLGSRFGLGPAATGAIAAALPGLLQRMTAHR
jgi:hypothetical protein